MPEMRDIGPWRWSTKIRWRPDHQTKADYMYLHVDCACGCPSTLNSLAAAFASERKSNHSTYDEDHNRHNGAEHTNSAGLKMPPGHLAESRSSCNSSFICMIAAVPYVKCDNSPDRRLSVPSDPMRKAKMAMELLSWISFSTPSPHFLIPSQSLVWAV